MHFPNFNRGKLALVFLVLSTFGGTGLMARDYYVSIEGTDRNPGTAEKPFRTLPGQ
jgi:hypothetical protein